MNHIEKGRKGEDIATSFLKKKNYQIIERNYRYKKMEIDIIACYGDTIVFFEVKTRSKTTFGYPEEFVSPAQELRIMEAATYFLETTALAHYFIRFDIISIIKNKNCQQVLHIEDAFH
ncbi:MAG: YraN family protein [Bacteroidota bacterium]